MNTENILNILLIEDDDSHAKIISRHLKQLDRAPFITHATTLNQGLKSLETISYHIILLDLRLPDSDISKSLPRTLEKSGTIPIIVLSSLEDKALARKMVHEGAQDYICKGELSGELLIRTIYSCIERKQIEIALQESENRKAKIINTSLDCIISIDEQGRIIEFNKAAEITFGFKRDEVLGQEMAELIIPANKKEAHKKGFRNYLRTGESVLLGKRIEMSAIRKDESEFPVELSIVSIQLTDQKIFTSFLRDITEQKKAAEELRKAKENAETSNLAKSAFLANMSHEIRTPLGAILGFSDLLMNDQISKEEKVGYAESVKHNGELLSKLINDILDLSKVEAGKIEVDVKAVYLQEILSDTKSLLELKANCKGISLEFLIDQNIPHIIYTDPLRLKQILINLVSNSIKFTDKGLITVKVEMDHSLPLMPKIAFAVKDTGLGISQEQIPKLFAPFSQLDNSTKRNFGGTGLGLFLSKRLSNLLGGDLKLTHSEQNKGSTFTLTLDPGPYYTKQLKLPKINTSLTSKNINYRLDGIKILLVDDSSDNRLLVSKFLTINGADVDAATNGKEAIEKTNQSNYDILLMDLQMPIMDGYEATAYLRSNGFKSPIVALTAHAMLEEKNRCLANGFDEHISKPVDRSQLIEKVYKLSSKKTSFPDDDLKNISPSL